MFLAQRVVTTFFLIVPYGPSSKYTTCYVFSPKLLCSSFFGLWLYACQCEFQHSIKNSAFSLSKIQSRCLGLKAVMILGPALPSVLWKQAKYSQLFLRLSMQRTPPSLIESLACFNYKYWLVILVILLFFYYCLLCLYYS